MYSQKEVTLAGLLCRAALCWCRDLTLEVSQIFIFISSSSLKKTYVVWVSMTIYSRTLAKEGLAYITEQSLSKFVSHGFNYKPVRGH